jgi:outer membrane protein insertion porin family
VDYETTPVPGSPDLVDVDYTIKEGLPGQFGGGIGYSGSQSAILNLNFVHTNFMGTGNRIAADINTGRFQKTFSFSETDPYTTIDGVSRTVSFTYRDINQFVSSSSEFSTKSGTVGVDYGYPITEFQTFRVGLAAQRAELLTVQSTNGGGSADEAIQFVQNNGDSFTRGGNVLGSRFTTYELNLGWTYDSRNRAIFADRGTLQRFSLGYTLPVSDVEFYTASYEYLKFVPLFGDLTLLFHPQVAYGEALGGTSALPPYRQFFAGGAETVRGFRDSRLGPQDSNGNPYGGNLQVIAQTELLLPIPEKFRNTARFSLFFDMGNVFSTDGVQFKGPPPDRNPVDYKFSFSELRQSAGLAVQWLAPLGVFRFSYAFPLKQKDGTPNRYGDETEGFQFSIGQAF